MNTARQYENWYTAFFVQDDWKVMPNLTVSAGVRIEHETPLVESHNGIVTGWDPTLTNAVTASSAAAYATSPSSALATSAFSAKGGVVYANSNNRSPYSNAPMYLSPRIGFSWAPEFGKGTLAVRGGVGIYVNPFNDYYTSQSYGFSQTTNFITSSNSGLSPLTTMDNPFPTSVNPILAPAGSAYGLNTNLGAGISFYYPNVKVQYSQKWDLDIQKQFGKNWMAEIGYFGARGVHLTASDTISATPLLPYLSRMQTADSTVTTWFKSTTNNPFYGIMPGNAATTGLNTSKTISIATLLQAYPEYSSVAESLMPFASSNFSSLMARLSKRFSDGLEFNVNYDWSRQLGNATILNQGASMTTGGLWYGETTSDFPQHVSVTGSYELPFGKGHPFFNQSKLLSEGIGGWKATVIYQFLSGTPVQWGNVVYNGNWHDFNSQPHNANGLMFNTSKFDVVSADQPNSYNYRTFPQYLLRSDATNNVDSSILKDFQIGEHIILQPRFDAFNLLNHPQMAAPNVSPTSASFGRSTGPQNTARQLQAGFHILF